MSNQPHDNQSLFRSDALQRHSAGRDEAIMLQVIRPRLFRLLWCLLGALVLVAGFLGAALVTKNAGTSPALNESNLLLHSIE